MVDLFINYIIFSKKWQFIIFLRIIIIKNKLLILIACLFIIGPIIIEF